jgi:hypothetical protein
LIFETCCFQLYRAWLYSISTQNIFWV